MIQLARQAPGRKQHAIDRAIEQRTRELGTIMFERAHAAEPMIWQRAWWEQRMLAFMAARPRLQTQLFRFMETVPHLRDDADIADHLQQYLRIDGLEVPLPLRAALLFDNPDGLWGRSVGAAVRAGAYQMATRFITGTNTNEAIAYAEDLRKRRMAFTLDVLGEATMSERQADRATAVYLELIEQLGSASRDWQHRSLIDEGRDGPMPRANISIKLSALDPVFDPVDPERIYATLRRRLDPMITRARQLNVFVNVDMEQFRYRDLTFAMFKRLLSEPEYRDWTDVGIVVQAYLRDSEDDLNGLLDWVDRRGAGIAIRLVKGAYWDTETTSAIRWGRPIPVWTRKWESDACYERLTRIMLANADRIRPAFASHNVRSLAHVLATAEVTGRAVRDYELQMLAGMGDPLKESAVQMGQCVRVYCPYGDLLQGMAYLIRRLLENTSNDSFLRQGFGDRGAYDRLLANPAIARTASTALPSRHYQNPFEDETMMQSGHQAVFENAVPESFASLAARQQMVEELSAARARAGHRVSLLIDGIEHETGEWIASTNPARPAELLAEVARAAPADADRAVAAATKALPEWTARSPFERAAVLRRTAELLADRRRSLTADLVLEIGKNPIQADAEVIEAIDFCAYHAGLAEQLARRPRRRDVPGEDNVLVYDPCGVCVLIGSWDFPLSLLAGMTSAAIALGNTCVLKPSSRAPLIAHRFCRILLEVRLPAGVVHYVPGAGSVVGRHLVEHPDVHLVAICGGREAAVDVAARSAQVRARQRHFKRAIIDAGAKNAIIVDQDVDTDEAVAGVLESAFAFSGQKCTACSRVIVLEGAYDAFCRKLADAAKVMRIGDPSDPVHQLGPVISAADVERIRAHVETAKASTPVLFEMPASQLPDEGHYVAPVIFKDVEPQSPLAKAEIFGPVLCVLRANNFDHALTLANDSRYALTGGLYSRSPAHIERCRWEFRVGNLYINRKITGSQVDVQPYGGSRMSGDGARLGGSEYLLQFGRPRTISENTLRHGLTAVQDRSSTGDPVPLSKN